MNAPVISIGATASYSREETMTIRSNQISTAIVRRFGQGIAIGALSATAFFAIMTPQESQACACGCGIFDVGTSSMFPDGAGGLVYLQFYYQNQNQNWSGNAAAPGQNNSDKNITTEWITAGLQYFFNRSWGVQAEIPYENRWFSTDTNFGNFPATIQTVNWADIGDVRIKGYYTGFSEDMSTGVMFGIKLPTGNYNFRPDIVDRDTQIGTGSTDLLLGVFHRGALTDDGNWGWFTQLQLDQPVLTRDDYYPGTEVDFVLGAHYKGWSIGQNTTITPIGQVLAQIKTTDQGANAASPPASGFQRILLAPGIEIDSGKLIFYADVSFPVYINATGNQLEPAALFKATLGYKF